MGIEIQVAGGDLTKGTESVLVNASNTSVWLGSGVSGAIFASCGGEKYQEQITAAMRARFGVDMAPCDVLVTDAGTHPRARYVAHAAVMDYRSGQAGSAPPDAARIERCCENLWAALETLDGPISVAVPALGAGVGGLGVRLPTEIACRTLRSHLARGRGKMERVTFYGYSLPDLMGVAVAVTDAWGDAARVPDEIRAHLDAFRGLG